MKNLQAPLVLMLALWMLSPAPLIGQGTAVVRGTVTESGSGAPVAGATITLVPGEAVDSARPFRTVTNASGTFRIEVPAGQYELRVQRVGFSADRATVVVTPGAEATSNIVLRAGFVSLDDLVAVTSGHMHSRHFQLHEPSYFIFGFGDGSASQEPTPFEYKSQVKFRIAVRYGLFQIPGVNFDSGIFFGYTQNSFWHLYDFDESAPFFDNNYNPQLFAHLDVRDLGNGDPSYWIPSPRIFVEHESNGRDGSASRSWNRVGGALDWGDPAEDIVYGSVALWHALGIAPENADISDTNGRGEVRLAIQPLLHTEGGLGVLGLSVKARILGEDPIANIEANAFVDPGLLGRSSAVLPTLMGQVFWGTGENLLTHDEKRLVFRLGIALIK